MNAFEERWKILEAIAADMRDRAHTVDLEHALEFAKRQVPDPKVDEVPADDAGQCSCRDIQAADHRRHFRGCKLREKYPEL